MSETTKKELKDAITALLTKDNTVYEDDRVETLQRVKYGIEEWFTEDQKKREDALSHIESLIKETREEKNLGPTLDDRLTSLEEKLAALDAKTVTKQDIPPMSIDGEAINPLYCALRTVHRDPMRNMFRSAYSYDSIVQGTWTWAAKATSSHDWVYYNNSGNIDDEIQYRFTHEKGKYTLNVFGEENSNQAICHVIVDGHEQGTLDMYAAAEAFQIIYTLDITFAVGGTHTISLKAASKNAKSTDYYMPFCFLWIT